MRVLLILVILALLLALIGFASANLETRAPVTLWQTTYQDVPVWSIVFISGNMPYMTVENGKLVMHYSDPNDPTRPYTPRTHDDAATWATKIALLYGMQEFTAGLFAPNRTSV